jgi:hypothetical protein
VIAAWRQSPRARPHGGKMRVALAALTRRKQVSCR